MLVACSTSAFREPLGAALEAIARLGFAHVDLLTIPSWEQIRPADLRAAFDAQASAIETLLTRYDLTPIAFNTAFGNLSERPPDLVAQRRAEAEVVARLAHRLGVKVASFYPGFRSPRPWDEVLADTVASIRELLAAGAEHGVEYVVELHQGTPFETVAQGRGLLAALPELRVAYDPSHYAMQGLDVRDTARFLDRAAHVHFRDAAPDQMQVPFGTGTVDFTWLLQALVDREYAGHASIEYLPGLPGDLAQSIRRTRDAVTG